MKATMIPQTFALILCLGFSPGAQTPPLRLRIVGDVETNKALQFL